VPRTFYRTIGYRVCGERAVRVDILERLADLIRPALAWRPSSPAPQPAGAFEGIGFTVTQAMTSLTGSSGEDFASILRALGYRMEKRPKPVTKEPVETAEAETPSAPETAADQPAAGVEPAADAGADSPVQAAGETAAFVEPAGAAEAAHDLTASEAAQQPSGDAASDDSSATAAIAEHHGAPDSAAPPVETAAAAAEAGVAETAAEAPADFAADPALSQAPAATAEPELVEVWRPGGRSEERRGQRRPSQRGHQPHGEAQARGPGAATEGGPAPEENSETAAEADAAGKKGGQHRRPRSQQGEFRRDREDGGERRPREHRVEHRSDRQGDRAERGRGERPNLAKGRGDHKDRRDFTPHREREKQADPNSPFAKLAALKAQLEAAAKERH
jgi:ATP-dependent RNA helicase SUPV3L1/SUV3